MTTATISPATRGRKRKIIQVRDIDALVKFLAENQVKRFKHGDLEIEIDTFVKAASRETPETLDAKVKQTASVFAETPEDRDRDLFWSTPG